MLCDNKFVTRIEMSTVSLLFLWSVYRAHLQLLQIAPFFFFFGVGVEGNFEVQLHSGPVHF